MSLLNEFGLKEKIENLTDGFDTIVHNGSEEVLSSGYRQQIIIARALIAKPKIILFDEANINLDMETDTLLLNYFKKINPYTTIVLISNRPSWLSITDENFIIENKNIVKINGH